MTCPHCQAGVLHEGAQRCPLCGQLQSAFVRRAPPSGPRRPAVLLDPKDPIFQPTAAPRRRRYRLGVALALAATGGALWLGAQPGRPGPLGPAPTQTRVAVQAPEPVAATPSPLPPPPPAPEPWKPVAAPPRPRPRPVVPVEQQPAYLSVSTRPWALLSVDGRLVGNTPKLKVRLKPGVHQVRLQRAGFKIYEAAVEVKAGETVAITNLTLSVTTP